VLEFETVIVHPSNSVQEIQNGQRIQEPWRTNKKMDAISISESFAYYVGILLG
jgi:hypothetical protein